MMDFMEKRISAKGKKAMHDPLAACIAIEPTIAVFARVKMYRVAKGGQRGWGAKPSPVSDTWISISANQDLFAQIFGMMG